MRKASLACFLAVVAVALAWRFTGLTYESLWLDEGYQSMVGAYGNRLPDLLQVPAQPFIFRLQAPSTPALMIERFRSVDFLTPPLYQLFLNRWIAAFGGSDFSVRSLSVVISVAGVAAVFLIANALLGTRAALFAGLLQAFSPFDVYYGQEVRMYGLEQLAATLCAGTLLMLLFATPRSRFQIWALVILNAVASWAVINSHYTGLFLVAFEVLLGAFVIIARRDRQKLVQLGTSWLLTLLAWVPWFPLFKSAAARRTASFYVARKPSIWWPLTALLFRIPANWVIFLTGKQVVGFAAPLYASSVILLLICPLLLVPPHMVRNGRHGLRFWRGLPGSAAAFRRRRTIAFGLMLWAVVPAVLLWAIDVVENHRVIEIARYLIATAPAIYILAGAAMAGLNWRSRLTWLLAFTQFFFAGVNNVAHATAYRQREPWRPMARLVEQKVPASELLLVSQYYDIVCLDRYLAVPYKQVGVSGITTRATLAAILAGQKRFALVTAQEGDRILANVPAQFQVTDHFDLGHSLHLYLYRIQAAQVPHLH